MTDIPYVRTAPCERPATRAWPGAIAFVALATGVGALGGLVTDNRGWFESLEKPPLTPPGAAFGPVWTTLYVMMGVAAFLVWRERDDVGRDAAVLAWTAQLGLNLAWTLLFFGAQQPGWALVDAIVLLLAILLTVVLFAPISRVAALLLVPYAAWVAFATYLNAGIVWLNPPGA